MDSGDERGMTGNDCPRAVELLPWFERGTLGEEEHRFVARHLDTCADCRHQLTETRRIAWVTRQHLPADVLADLACDLEPEAAWPREEIEAHLELCPSCREELATARGTTSPAPALRFPERLPQRFWRPVALAASLVATLAVASLLWQQQQPQRPQIAGIATGGALVELMPESYRTRDGGETATVLDRERPATLLLVTLAADPVLDGVVRRALLTTADGQLVHQVDDLVADRTGTVVLHVPAGTLPAGSMEVALQASGPAGWATLETYRYEVR
jgi:hypothetical protein